MTSRRRSELNDSSPAPAEEPPVDLSADPPGGRFELEDRLPPGYAAVALRSDVRTGLTASPKSLPPKWFYDARGSELFEEITRLPEYYPTRAESEILASRAGEIATATRAATLVELGSGSSEKTRLLLDALHTEGELRAYIPVDVSASALRGAAQALRDTYPDLHVRALAADFGRDLGLERAEEPRLLAFLGGTVGNLLPTERTAFLRRVREALGPRDALLLGTDLVKDPATLVAAYDDAAGVTARFNKNVLSVLNRELGAGFDPDAFHHIARWDPDQEWMEMRLRARWELTVKVRELDLEVSFARGEDLRTEISAKFRREGVRSELAEAGLAMRHWWTDDAGRYALSLSFPAQA